MSNTTSIVRPSKDNEFVRTLERLINATTKTQTEIAEEIGYDNPNMITMFKTGMTRVPMNKVVPIAKAIDADPGMMLKLWFDTYMPEALSTIQMVAGGFILTDREKGWVKGIRHYYGNDLPAFDSGLISGGAAEAKHLTLRLSPLISGAVWQLAAELDTSPHSLLLEGLNVVFERHGKPPVA